MGEGLLPGGVFRQAAPGEFEINIPGIAESPVNKIIRQAYNGKHKGQSERRTPDGKLYPEGFTPPQDYITDDSWTVGSGDVTTIMTLLNGDLPEEMGIFPNLEFKKERVQQKAYLQLQEAPLRFFDSPMVQFRHLLEYNDSSNRDGYNHMENMTDGSDGQRPGITYEFSRENGNFINPTYLASYVRTHRENEDPTLLGFDFHIRVANSPLFNGTLEKFLLDYGQKNLELRNRLILLREFKKQFFAFFKAYEPNHINENLPSVGDFNGNTTYPTNNRSKNLTNNLLKNLDSSADMKDTYLGSSAKAYYVQSISGLGKLNESNEYGDTGQSQRFVKWGSDFLTITVNEDVGQNMGYLASLYKSLTWSRERGRLPIPENLLRFEVVLDITEIRNYVRVYGNGKQVSEKFSSEGETPPSGKDWVVIADQTSKYRYFVHECQFFFPSMPHGDTLTTSPQENVKGLDFKIFFKNSNLRFMKFTPPLNAKTKDNDYTSYHQRYTSNSIKKYDDYFRIKVIDNSKAYTESDVADTKLDGSAGLKKSTIYQDGNLSPSARNTSPIGYPIEIFKDTFDSKIDNINNNVGMDDLERRRAINSQLSFKDKLKVGAKNALKSLKQKALNIGQNFVNQQIISLASLINRSLNQLFNSLPVVGGIKPPKNIYEKAKGWEKAYVDFIGPGIKSFFENPTQITQLQPRAEGKPGETLEERIARASDFGNTPANTNIVIPGFDTIDAFSNVPSIGNSADTGTNRKLDEIVAGDPSFGINDFIGEDLENVPGYPFFSPNAAVGNLGGFVKNPLTLEQTVANDTSFGDPNANTSITIAGLDTLDAFSNIPSIGNSAEPGNNRTLKQIVDSNPGIGIANANTTLNTGLFDSIDTFSNDPSLGNSADPGVNRTLKQIVDSDPGIGIASANTTLNTGLFDSIDTFSNDPSQGNSADAGINLKLQEIVNNNPEWGIENNTTDPSIGNSAKPGTNRLLDQIVKSNPEWGNQNSTIDPSIGNNANTGTNITLQQIVDSDPEFGNNAGITTIPSLGNNAQPGNNQTLQQIVDSDPLFGNNAGITTIPSLGNNAVPGTNLTLQQIVDSDPQFGNGGGITTIPSLGNNAQPGNNQTLQQIVDSDLSLGLPGSGIPVNAQGINDPALGNNAEIGNNLTLQEIVDSDPGLGNGSGITTNPSLGNSAISGNNIQNNLVVLQNSTVINPSLGNNADSGDNVLLNATVVQNTMVVNPEEGNSAPNGSNIENNELIENSSVVELPSQGNSAEIGKNVLIEKVVDQNTKLTDPFDGNSSSSGINIKNDKLVDDRSVVTDSELGNQAFLSKNKPNIETVEKYTSVQNPSLGNNGLISKNVQNDELVSKNSTVIDPYVSNGAQEGKNNPTSVIIENLTDVENPSQGNSAEYGVNYDKNFTVSSNTGLVNQNVGNSGREGINSEKDEIISINSTIEDSQIGNSGNPSGNIPLQSIVDGKTSLDNSEIGNSGVVKGNTTKDETVNLYSQLNDPNLSNGGTLGVNSDKNSIVLDKSKLENPSLGNSAPSGTNLISEDKVEFNTNQKNPEVGNSAIFGFNDDKNEIVKSNSDLKNPQLGNNAQMGKSQKLDEIVDKESDLENPQISNSAESSKNVNLDYLKKYSSSKLYGTVDWNNIQFPQSGNRLP